jgi:hypothetical protein
VYIPQTDLLYLNRRAQRFCSPALQISIVSLLINLISIL